MSDLFEASATFWWCFQLCIFEQQPFFSRIQISQLTTADGSTASGPPSVLPRKVVARFSPLPPLKFVSRSPVPLVTVASFPPD
jgi:hypothetical protein